MMINGTLDTFIQWNGGSIHKGAKRGAGGEVIPVPETARFWREHNSCSAHPTTKQLPDIDKDDGTTVKVLSYPDCKDPGSFLWVQVVGGGHTWPGTKLRKRPFVARLMGAVSQDIDASQMIWDFFKGYRLAQSGADIK
jgi:polyhydroxybutyrate depolymerase